MPPCATSRSSRELGAADLGALGARARRDQDEVGAIDEPVDGRRRRRSGRATRRARRRRRGGGGRRADRRGARPPRGSARSSERVKRAKLQAGALSYDLDGLRERVEGRVIARRRPHRPRRAAHARAATRACASSIDVLGMEIEAREGQSVFLRGWGDYQRYSLKLTESDRAGLGPHGAARLEPGGARAPGGGDRGDRAAARAGSTATSGTAPPTASPTPTATRWSSTSRPRSYVPPEHLRPVAEEPAAALHRRAARRSSGSTTSTCSPPTSPPTATFAERRARLPPLRADPARRRQRGRRLDEPDASPRTS